MSNPGSVFAPSDGGQHPDCSTAQGDDAIRQVLRLHSNDDATAAKLLGIWPDSLKTLCKMLKFERRPQRKLAGLANISDDVQSDNDIPARPCQELPTSIKEINQLIINPETKIFQKPKEMRSKVDMMHGKRKAGSKETAAVEASSEPSSSDSKGSLLCRSDLSFNLFKTDIPASPPAGLVVPGVMGAIPPLPVGHIVPGVMGAIPPQPAGHGGQPAGPIVPPVAGGVFSNRWEMLGPESELQGSYTLGEHGGLQEVVTAVTQMTEMQPCDGPETVPHGALSHTLLLAWAFGDTQATLVLVRLAISTSNQVVMTVVIRATSPELSDIVHQSLELRITDAQPGKSS